MGSFAPQLSCFKNIPWNSVKFMQCFGLLKSAYFRRLYLPEKLRLAQIIWVGIYFSLAQSEPSKWIILPLLVPVMKKVTVTMHTSMVGGQWLISIASVPPSAEAVICRQVISRSICAICFKLFSSFFTVLCWCFIVLPQ